jgi:hypothetical protein
MVSPVPPYFCTIGTAQEILVFSKNLERKTSRHKRENAALLFQKQGEPQRLVFVAAAKPQEAATFAYLPIKPPDS